uniref:Conotoxin O3 superfamily protein n=1 Tax=Conus ebraeus TaxID=89425 RepID=A0AA50QZI2_CONEA|nr:conotoxin precursor O3 [Conus ebraeus]UMA82576.1 conotoxin precursor O3 [Conus ebraeus]WMD30201.1 conotoxin precursor O3 superfamily protein [Conus ebraeus]DAZ86062.1 TPA_inf: conotoxin precursor O3 [Conus ebraeus]DAZ86253.1 TPA_inf: conotoxin precursor O3 [Conus ebraeus]
MSGLGIMVLTLLLLVSMATSHTDRGVGLLMPRDGLQERTCTSDDDCGDLQCCPDTVDKPEGRCDSDCTIY